MVSRKPSAKVLGAGQLMNAGRAIDAAECRRQAAFLEQAAPGEPDISIRTALLSMSAGWLTLEKQIEWVAQMRGAEIARDTAIKDCGVDAQPK
jgi:hypothetical protein